MKDLQSVEFILSKNETMKRMSNLEVRSKTADCKLYQLRLNRKFMNSPELVSLIINKKDGTSQKSFPLYR